MRRDGNLYLAVTLSVVLTLTLATAACFKASESQLDKMINGAAKIAERYPQAVNIVDDLWEKRVIKSYEVKNRIADALIAFGEHGLKFHALLKVYAEQFKNGNVPVNVWKQISENFDTMQKNFLLLLSLLPQAEGLSQSAAFRAISAAILAIATTLAQAGVNVPNLPRMQQEAAKYGLARA